MKLKQNYVWTGMIVLIAVFLVLFKYWDYIANPWTRDGQVRAKVVQITPRVSGRIVKLAVKDNQFVNKGDLLFQIDPRTFEASVEQAKAQYDKAGDNYLAQEKNVDAAKAQIDASRAQVLQAQSSIKQADAQMQKNKAEYERQQELLPKRATSQKSLERARANYDVSVQQRVGALATTTQAKAALAEVEADLGEAQANLGSKGDANASIREAKAAMQQAKLNLEFTKVIAPVDGYVTNLNLWLGSQAVANQPALALVDVNSFWVDGFFKETLIGPIRHGDKA
ncbi:MAG: multidrug resistance efflux pump, partial [Enterobacterales bacterium]